MTDKGTEQVCKCGHPRHEGVCYVVVNNFACFCQKYIPADPPAAPPRCGYYSLAWRCVFPIGHSGIHSAFETPTALEAPCPDCQHKMYHHVSDGCAWAVYGTRHEECLCKRPSHAAPPRVECDHIRLSCEEVGCPNAAREGRMATDAAGRLRK